MKRNLASACVLGAVAAAAIGVTVAPAGAAGPSVTIKDISFKPKRLSVSRGTTVTFRWRDGSTTHDVTSVGRKRFRNLGRRSSGARSVRFAKAGTYRYVCTLHPGMAGSIVVR